MKEIFLMMSVFTLMSTHMEGHAEEQQHKYDFLGDAVSRTQQVPNIITLSNLMKEGPVVVLSFWILNSIPYKM